MVEREHAKGLYSWWFVASLPLCSYRRPSPWHAKCRGVPQKVGAVHATSPRGLGKDVERGQMDSGGTEGGRYKGAGGRGGGVARVRGGAPRRRVKRD